MAAILGAPASWRALCLLAALLLLAGCRNEDMAQQPKYKTMRPSTFFADAMAARPLVEGVVSRSGQVEHAQTRDEITQPGFPRGFPTRGPELKMILERGRQRYEIYCSVCHGSLGDGDGMVVRRGFVQAPSFHEAKLRTAPPAHFYNVISNGYGAMYSYANRVKPADRWAITAYIRALQVSQYFPVDRLPPAERQKVTQ